MASGRLTNYIAPDKELNSSSPRSFMWKIILKKKLFFQLQKKEYRQIAFKCQCQCQCSFFYQKSKTNFA